MQMQYCIDRPPVTDTSPIVRTFDVDTSLEHSFFAQAVPVLRCVVSQAEN